MYPALVTFSIRAQTRAHTITQRQTDVSKLLNYDSTIPMCTTARSWLYWISGHDARITRMGRRILTKVSPSPCVGRNVREPCSTIRLRGLGCIFSFHRQRRTRPPNVAHILRYLQLGTFDCSLWRMNGNVSCGRARPLSACQFTLRRAVKTLSELGLCHDLYLFTSISLMNDANPSIDAQTKTNGRSTDYPIILAQHYHLEVLSCYGPPFWTAPFSSRFPSGGSTLYHRCMMGTNMSIPTVLTHPGTLSLLVRDCTPKHCRRHWTWTCLSGVIVNAFFVVLPPLIKPSSTIYICVRDPP